MRGDSVNAICFSTDSDPLGSLPAGHFWMVRLVIPTDAAEQCGALCAQLLSLLALPFGSLLTSVSHDFMLTRTDTIGGVMKIRVILAALLFLPAVASFAQETSPPAAQAAPPKEPWQMTDDERIAARLDPEKIRQRSEAHSVRLPRHHSEGPSGMAVGATSQPIPFVIDGAANPELFFRFELFAYLLRGVDPKLTGTDREVARALLMTKIKAFGYEPETFWNELSASVPRYFEVRDGVSSRSPSKHARIEAIAPPSGPDDVHTALCRERLTALSSARNHFGSETFDRFLYSVVAPTITVTSNPPGPEEGAGLRFLEGGCQ